MNALVKISSHITFATIQYAYKLVQYIKMSSSGSPIVTLDEEDEEVEACLDTSVKFKATILGFTTKYDVIWTKDNQKIYITDPKYKGSENEGSSAVLEINDVKKEDEGTYTIEVHNEFGKGKRSLKLVVIKGKIYVIFNIIIR